jgi:hypothetical protein
MVKTRRRCHRQRFDDGRRKGDDVMGWLTAGGGYQVTLDDGRVVCRNAKGRLLGSIPAKLRDDPAVVTLGQLREWLARHETGCREEVERWMMGSLPVPTALLAQIWADETWRRALTDLLVAGYDPAAGGRGGWCPGTLGFLREVGPDGVGIVDRDGATRYLREDHIVIPHPVFLDDLGDLRDLATDFGVIQTVNQLFRRVWVRQDSVDPARCCIDRYAGGRYGRPHDLVVRATASGYRVSGSYAVCRVFEAGREIQVRVWIGADDHYTEAQTGELTFSADGRGSGDFGRGAGGVLRHRWGGGFRRATDTGLAGGGHRARDEYGAAGGRRRAAGRDRPRRARDRRRTHRPCVPAPRRGRAVCGAAGAPHARRGRGPRHGVPRVPPARAGGAAGSHPTPGTGFPRPGAGHRSRQRPPRP